MGMINDSLRRTARCDASDICRFEIRYMAGGSTNGDMPWSRAAFQPSTRPSCPTRHFDGEGEREREGRARVAMYNARRYPITDTVGCRRSPAGGRARPRGHAGTTPRHRDRYAFANRCAIEYTSAHWRWHGIVALSGRVSGQTHAGVRAAPYILIPTSSNSAPGEMPARILMKNRTSACPTHFAPVSPTRPADEQLP